MPQKFSQSQAGFTVIELMLSMAFVGVLVITIAIIATNIITIYQKGITVKTVSEVGREMIREITDSINAGPSVDSRSLCNAFVVDGKQEECLEDNANKFVYQETRDADGVQLNGIFCTGSFSYIWVTPDGEGAGAEITLQYSGGTEQWIDFLKVRDPNYRVCSAAMATGSGGKSTYESRLNPGGTTTIDITKLMISGATNYIPTPENGFLLSKSEMPLKMYDLRVYPIAQDKVTLRTFMSGSFVIATRTGASITVSDNYCKTDQYYDWEEHKVKGGGISLGSDFNYCAINKFSFAGRTAGGRNES